MKYYLGIDLGGTNIAVGLVNERYELIRKISAPTPKGADCKTLSLAIRDVCVALLTQMNVPISQVECAGIGTPGQVNSETGMLGFACNLSLRNVPLGLDVSAALGVKTFLANDADAAAFGEAAAGAAKGTKSSVTITLGTGVGCGVVLGKTIVPGEGGHMVMVYNGLPCNCGRKGCIESYCSATALIRQTQEAMDKNPKSLMWDSAKEQGKVNGRVVFEAMKQGDAAAKEVFDTYVGYVACGVINIVDIIQPEMVCIGGGISGEGELLVAPIRKLVQKEQYPLADDVLSRVEACQLGNDAGIIGAALFGQYL